MDTITKLKVGLIVTVIGMVVVFAVLVFLAYIFRLMELLARYSEKKKNSAAISVTAPSDGVPLSVEVSALVAVISAAVAACADSNKKLVVRSITRARESIPVWTKTGRQDQMTARMFE